MAISLKHNFVSPKSDGGDDTLVRPSDWNAEHALTQGTGTLLGRTTAGTGATEEITPGSGLSFTSQTLSVSLAGSNTYIQFNDSGVFGGTAGFTFDKTTNNIVIGNTVTVGTNFIANGSGAYPLNNTSGIALGSSTQRWNLTGNTISVTGTITASGNITGSNVNGAIGYFTGLVNAANFITTGNMNAGSTYVTGGTYPTNNTSGTALGSTTARWILNANTGNFSGHVTHAGDVLPSGNTSQSLGGTNARWHIYANQASFSAGIFPVSNTVGVTLGNAASRFNLSANTIDASGNIITTGNVNGAAGFFTGTVNAAHFTTTGNANAGAGYFGGVVNATTFTTTGNVNGAAGFFTGTINAAHFITTGNANSGSVHVTGGVYPVSNSSGQTLGDGTRRWVITANSLATSGGIITSGGASPASNSSGTALGTTTARWELVANTIATSGAITSSGGINPASNTVGTELGSGTALWNMRANTFVSYNYIVPSANNIQLGGAAARWDFYANNASFSGNLQPVSNTAGLSIGDATHRWLIVANTGNFTGTITTAGGTLTSAGIYPTNNTSGTALGSATQRWVLTANSADFTGVITSTANVTTSGNVNAVTGNFSGDVLISSETNYLRLGDTTANIVANNENIVLANSTVSWNISKPTAAEVSAGDYYLGSDGTWQQPAATTDAAGSDTYVQFNDGGTVFGGTAGFTFTKTTNNVTIGNTITVGTNFIANGSGAYPVNNTSGTALGSATQRWVIAANTGDFSGTVWANQFTAQGTGVLPQSNTVGTTLGDGTRRWNLTGNNISVSGTITASGNITGSNVNGAIGYFTGLVNAAHFTTTGNANAAIHYAGANVYSNTTSVRVGNSVVNTVISNNQIYLGNSISNAIINSTSITMNGTGTESLSNSFVTSAGPDTVDSFVFAATRSAEYFYTVIHDGANAYQSGKVILLNDGGGGHLEEYGVAYSNTTQGLIGEFSSTTNATHIILQFTPASTISYTVKAVKNSMNA